jgi:hypothetical protein
MEDKYWDAGYPPVIEILTIQENEENGVCYGEFTTLKKPYRVKYYSQFEYQKVLDERDELKSKLKK